MLIISSFRTLAIVAVVAVNTVAYSQSLVEPPVVKVLEEPSYTVYLRYFDNENVEVYTRVYKRPTDSGKVVINAIHIQNEEMPYGVLIYEHIYKDNYAHSLLFNRSQLYSITMDKFPGGQEAILVYRTKDRKLIAVIGKKKTGEWVTENDEELNTLVRKYHPELNK